MFIAVYNDPPGKKLHVKEDLQFRGICKAEKVERCKIGVIFASNCYMGTRGALDDQRLLVTIIVFHIFA